MSNLTISDLTFITREDLSSTLLSASASASASATPSASTPNTTASAATSTTHPPPTISLPSLAIIDVRDDDHLGGHIRGSTWVPSSELDYRIPELVRTLKEKDVVVFHCALSQQRGPSAALRYLREKARLEGRAEGGVKDTEGKENGEGEDAEKNKQKVVVLAGGFTEWQEKYGEDKRLTEGYAKDIWEFGY